MSLSGSASPEQAGRLSSGVDVVLPIIGETLSPIDGQHVARAVQDGITDDGDPPVHRGVALLEPADVDCEGQPRCSNSLHCADQLLRWLPYDWVTSVSTSVPENGNGIQDPLDPAQGPVSVRCIHDEAEDGHSGAHQVIVHHQRCVDDPGCILGERQVRVVVWWNLVYLAWRDGGQCWQLLVYGGNPLRQIVAVVEPPTPPEAWVGRRRTAVDRDGHERIGTRLEGACLPSFRGALLRERP